MDLVPLAVSQYRKAKGVLPSFLPSRQQSCHTFRIAECAGILLFFPFRFCWFLTNRRPPFLTASVKIVILSTIIFANIPQGILLPRPEDWHIHRGTTPFSLKQDASSSWNQFAGDLATQQHSLYSWLFRSQQCQETMQKQVAEPISRDTKERDDNQWTPFSATKGKLLLHCVKGKTSSWLLNNMLDSYCCRQYYFFKFTDRGS